MLLGEILVRLSNTLTLSDDRERFTRLLKDRIVEMNQGAILKTLLDFIDLKYRLFH